jgi:hypothetical protein
MGIDHQKSLAFILIISLPKLALNLDPDSLDFDQFPLTSY